MLRSILFLTWIITPALFRWLLIVAYIFAILLAKEYLPDPFEHQYSFGYDQPQQKTAFKDRWP